jgi:hypothetical protein
MNLLKDEHTHVVYFMYEAIIATCLDIFYFQNAAD